LRQPHVEFEKLAPENEFIYKAVVLTVPSVEIGDLKSVKVKDIHIEVSPAEVDKIIEEMKEYSALETLENRPAVNGDKVEINFNVYRDGVPIEGGQADKHSLILGKQTMIPGFEEKIVGMCAGEEKEFELAFPEKYHAKHLAGQKCVFKIKVNGVFKRTLPDADDNLAKTHGKENLAELKQTIEHNLKHEQEDKQNQRLELEIIEGALKKSKFGEIPDELVNQEIDRMISELKQNIGRQGMKYEDYLGHIKKDELALRLDLAAQALDRVKAALLTRAIYFQHKLTVSEEDIDAELSKLKELYAQNPQVMQTLNSPSYREMTQNTLANKKVMMYLKTEVQLEK
jgi:trigger factor